MSDYAARCRDIAATAPRAPSEATNRGPSCGQDMCRCTHEHPCDRGWVDMPPRVQNGMEYERVAPCPICRPGAATRYQRDLEATSRKAPR